MTTLHHSVQGNGEMNVLLIHGMASSCCMWKNLIANSTLEATWWALDLPGFGKSAAPEGVISIDDHVAAVIRFLEECDIRPTVIFSHSTGGAVALKLAYIRPDLVERMVLISPVVTGEFTSGGIFSKIVRSPAGTAFLRSTPSLLQMIQKSGVAEHFSDIAGLGISDKTIKRQMIDDFHAMDAATGIETIISLAQHDMSQFLPEIQHPTLVAVGDMDLTVPCSEGKTAALHMPHAELQMYKGAYHYPHEQYPKEFATHVQALMDR
jgi:pimeloyl-ACP methyl ester carboxylesterase